MCRALKLGLYTIFAMLAASCALPRLDVFTGSYGSLQVDFGNFQPKTLSPDISSVPAYFEITGTGPSDESFSVSSSEESTTFDGLIFGTWSVSAEVFNAESRLIGEGSGEVEIRSGETENLSIEISPITGQGDISVGLQWAGDLLTNPAINAQLVGDGALSQTVNFAIDGVGSASVLMADVPSGYYTMTVNLLDGTAVVAGLTEVVRVMTGQITEGV
ncbi:MAG: hypothetical protein HN368_12125, partial [Spirochaetales bacterium]|nr:hypothetical protein [Spirochaetales bacterium]